jgi:hypothetical protein
MARNQLSCLCLVALAVALPCARAFGTPSALRGVAQRPIARRAPVARPLGVRRLLATATEAARGARRGACGVYPDWPAVPSLEEAVQDPGALLRTLTSQLLSVPTPVMGQRITYDFLANGEVRRARKLAGCALDRCGARVNPTRACPHTHRLSRTTVFARAACARQVSTGLTRWRESAWAWRNVVGSAFLAPYDELDAVARRAKADDGLCLIASSTDQVDTVR